MQSSWSDDKLIILFTKKNISPSLYFFAIRFTKLMKWDSIRYKQKNYQMFDFNEIFAQLKVVNFRCLITQGKNIVNHVVTEPTHHFFKRITSTLCNFTECTFEFWHTFSVHRPHIFIHNRLAIVCQMLPLLGPVWYHL